MKADTECTDMWPQRGRLPGCFGARLGLPLVGSLALWTVCFSGSWTSFSSRWSSSLSSVVSSVCVAWVRSNSPFRPSVSNSCWAYNTEGSQSGQSIELHWIIDESDLPDNILTSMIWSTNSIVCVKMMIIWTSFMMLSNSFCISSFISSILSEGTEMSDISSSNSCSRRSSSSFSSSPSFSVTLSLVGFSPRLLAFAF